MVLRLLNFSTPSLSCSFPSIFPAHFIHSNLSSFGGVCEYIIEYVCMPFVFFPFPSLHLTLKKIYLHISTEARHMSFDKKKYIWMRKRGKCEHISWISLNLIYMMESISMWWSQNRTLFFHYSGCFSTALEQLKFLKSVCNIN